MEDRDPQIRIQSIRASETLYKAGDKSLAADFKRLSTDSDTDVVMQSLMTMNTLKVADAAATLKAIQEKNKAKGVQLVASSILNRPANGGRGGGFFIEAAAALTPEEQAVVDKGREVFTQVCFACHGEDGNGGRVPGSGNAPLIGPPLAASPRVVGPSDYVVKVLLHGVTGPLDGITYPDAMIPMGMQSDEWIAAIGSYVRNAFGNRAALITAADVARVRAATASRKTPWTSAELVASVPRLGLPEALEARPRATTRRPRAMPRPCGRGARARRRSRACGCRSSCRSRPRVAGVVFESPAALVDTTPAVPGAPTRTASAAAAAARLRSRHSRADSRWCCRWTARPGANPVAQGPGQRAW